MWQIAYPPTNGAGSNLVKNKTLNKKESWKKYDSGGGGKLVMIRPTNEPTPGTPDYHQYLTPFYVLQLCSFPRLTAATMIITPIGCTF